MDSQTDLFAPPTQEWVPLSPRYANQRRVGTTVGWLLLAVLVGVPLWLIFNRDVALIAAGAVVVLGSWRLLRQGRIARAWGYAERETDLYIKRGLWWRRLTVVPYGRMQAVEVEAGPIQRAFNLATVSLVTASAQSDARIPGLDPEAAALLRDRLTERGETQAAGL